MTTRTGPDSELLKTVIWNQFGAAIDMLENAMRSCPDALWSDRSRRPEFWYVAFHTAFWLDAYLSDTDQGFSPPAPFTTDEFDPAGLMPDRVYGKDELFAYLAHGREKCRASIAGLTDARAAERCVFTWRESSRLELLLYNMRHVQHHAAQLNLILRQQTDSAPNWVSRTGIPLDAG